MGEYFAGKITNEFQKKVHHAGWRAHFPQIKYFSLQP
jgi:hypothetical protein